MVKLPGHLAMALLFAIPAWVLWDGRTSLAFVVFVAATSMLPDLDLFLPELGLPVEHHGVLHTVAFVAAVAVITGPVVVALIRPALGRWWRISEAETIQTGTLHVFVTGGFALGGVSHLLADVIAADAHKPIRPLWPIVDEPVAIEIAHFASPWLNAGLLVVAVSLHVALAVVDVFPIEHRFRTWIAELPPDDSTGSKTTRDRHGSRR